MLRWAIFIPTIMLIYAGAYSVMSIIDPELIVESTVGFMDWSAALPCATRRKVQCCEYSYPLTLQWIRRTRHAGDNEQEPV